MTTATKTTKTGHSITADKYYWDVYETMESKSPDGEYAHPSIILFRRYGDNLEYHTDMLRIEFQRNLTPGYNNEPVNPDKVYGGRVDMTLSDLADLNKLVTKIDAKRHELGLSSTNVMRDNVTALRALGFREIHGIGTDNTWVS